MSVRIFGLYAGLRLVAKRLEHVAGADPPLVRIISDNPICGAEERSAEEVNVVGRIRWGAKGDLRACRMSVAFAASALLRDTAASPISDITTGGTMSASTLATWVNLSTFYT